MKAQTFITLAVIIFIPVLITTGTSLAINVGDKAPPFRGESTHGTIRLADFTGKQNIILALYFAIFTPV